MKRDSLGFKLDRQPPLGKVLHECWCCHAVGLKPGILATRVEPCWKMVRDMPIRPVIVAAMIFTGLLGLAKPGQCQCSSGSPGHKLPDGLSLVIKTQKSTIPRDEHLVIHVELSNKSKTSVIMRRWLVDEWNYWVRAVDNKGREVRLTDYGTKIRPPMRIQEVATSST